MGLCLSLCAISNFYYGLFSVLLGICIVLYKALSEGMRIRWGRFIGCSALGAVLFVCLVGPVLHTLSNTMSAADAMVNRDPDFVWESLLKHNMTDMVGFLRPGKVYSPDLKALYGEDLLIVVYLGWVPLLCSLAAWVMRRRRRDMLLWSIIFVVFLIFSLGPYLYIHGEYIRYQGRMIPLPFLPFFEAFPIFSRISHPFRFVVPATLGLSIMTGYGVLMLTRGMSVWSKRLSVGAVITAALAEVLLGSGAVWPIPRAEAQIPVAYDLLEDGAVLDLPITVPNLERAVYTYYQTRHGLPSPYGLNEPLPKELNRNRFTKFLVYIESGYVDSLPPMVPDLELVSSARMLKNMGYRYVVVHENLYTTPKLEMIESVLTGILGEPRKYPSDGVALYEFTQ